MVTNYDLEMMYMADTRTKAYKTWAQEQAEEIVIDVNLESLNKAIDSLVKELSASDFEYLWEDLLACQCYESHKDWLIDMLADPAGFTNQVKIDGGCMSAGDIFYSYFKDSEDVIINENLDYAPDYLFNKLNERAGALGV